MSTSKLKRFIHWVGPILIVLGVANIAAMPWVSKRFDSLASIQFSIFILLYLASCSAVVLCGVIQWLWRRGPRSIQASTTLIASALYVLGLGVGAVYVAPLHPISYVLCLAGLLAILAAFSKPKQPKPKDQDSADDSHKLSQ